MMQPTANTRVIALIDCDNFYASCELVWRRELQTRPVVVLGSNDRCVIARNRFAKALGIPMGQPYARCRALLQRHHGVAFSANFPLYQDMSNRIMRLLASFGYPVEIHSIDEAFLDLSMFPHQKLTALAHAIRQRLLQWTGIAVTCGIGASKVQAKLACEYGKSNPQQCHGVCNLLEWSPQNLETLLTHTLAEDVWGIGQRYASRLQRELGILTARGLRDADHLHLRHVLGVSIQRIALELRGICCLPIITASKPRQTIMVALSFAHPITNRPSCLQAIACYVALAAHKLRRQQLHTAHLSVFLSTNPFDAQAPQYVNSAAHTLPFPTSFTPELIQVAQSLLSSIYRPGYAYKKVGVLLSDLRPQHVLQPDLFQQFSWEEQARRAHLMAIVDLVNAHLGQSTLFWGAQGLHRPWFPHAALRSPRATTNWQELLALD
jgi:DNA polymerase V